MKTISVRVKRRGGWCYEAATGEEIGPFVVHPAIDGDDDFVLTHVATGLAAARGPDADVCKHAAKLFMQLDVSWDFKDKAVIKTWPDSVMAQVNVIRTACSFGGEA